ncbi:MAG: pyruvate kinase [Candidatus Nezhaarchaeota archaeon]|nr:pyruvate kinase [Candidatus Nezhaarchaeota archaeon]
MVKDVKTKIIASLGPSSSSFETILKLVEAGVSGFRINFAHGDHSFWSHVIDNLFKVEELLRRPLTLIGDLRGSSIRLGEINGVIQLKRGDKVKLILSDKGSADKHEVPLPVKVVYELLDVEDVILMDDGKVKLQVLDVTSNYKELMALTDAVIWSRKSLAVLNKDFELPALTDKDLADLKFALNRNVDYLGLSYVRTPADILSLRSILKRWGHEDVKVIAKIETKSAIENLDEIVEAADAVLVARGDLGMAMGLENVPRLQRLIVSKAIDMERPVIIATQLLESMMDSPVPTRAEVVDINAAVSEGVDALMLTGETAVGKYPIEAVKWLRRIIKVAEENLQVTRHREAKSLWASFTKGVISLAEDLKAKLIIYSVYGNTARLASLMRPTVDFYVGTPNIKVLRQINILWGVKGYLVKASSYDEGLEETFKLLRQLNEVKLGDLAILTYGLRGDEQVIRVKRVEG